MTAEQIVEKLANSPEPADRLSCFCLLCNRSLTLCRFDDHEKDCPWRLAKEFVGEKLNA